MIADALAALLIGLVLGVGIVILAGMLTQWTLNISENEVGDGPMTECVECGKDLNDPKNAGDPDVDGEWVCRDETCRAIHDTEMTVNLGELFG